MCGEHSSVCHYSLLQGHQDDRTRFSTLHLIFTSRTLLQGHQDDRTRTFPSYFFFFFFLNTDKLHTLTSYLPSYFFFFFFLNTDKSASDRFLLLSSSSSSSTLTSQLRTGILYFKDIRTTELELLHYTSSLLQGLYFKDIRTTELADKLPSFLFLLLLLPQH